MLRLERLLDRVSAEAGGFEGLRHPTLGPMSRAQWLRWGYLHADHHLRQFGAWSPQRGARQSAGSSR